MAKINLSDIGYQRETDSTLLKAILQQMVQTSGGTIVQSHPFHSSMPNLNSESFHDNFITGSQFDNNKINIYWPPVGGNYVKQRLCC